MMLSWQCILLCVTWQMIWLLMLRVGEQNTGQFGKSWFVYGGFVLGDRWCLIWLEGSIVGKHERA